MSLYSKNLMRDNNNDYGNDNLIKITQVHLKSLKEFPAEVIKGFLRPSRELDFYVVQLTSHRVVGGLNYFMAPCLILNHA